MPLAPGAYTSRADFRPPLAKEFLLYKLSIIGFNYGNLKRLEVKAHYGRCKIKPLARTYISLVVLCTVALVIVFGLPGCSKKEPDVIKIRVIPREVTI